jgi:hypothetical protein
MPQPRKQKSLGRSDRWPSDYGERDHQSERRLAKKKSASKMVPNVDEQGNRANVKQNTPPKSLRNKR